MKNAFSLSDSRWHLRKSRNAAVHKGSVCNFLTSAWQVKKKGSKDYMSLKSRSILVFILVFIKQHQIQDYTQMQDSVLFDCLYR